MFNREEIVSELKEELKDNSKTSKLEIMDKPTSDIQYLINNLIDNVGIIKECQFNFPSTSASKILQVLSNDKELLNEKSIKWNISNDDDLILKIKNK